MTAMQKNKKQRSSQRRKLYTFKQQHYQNIFVQMPSRLNYLVLNSHGPYKYVAVCLEDKPGCVLSKAVLE